MVKSQSTLTGRAVTFSARTSLLQPQGNGLFSRTSVNQSFFDRHKGHRGSRPVLRYQRSVTSIVENFMKHIIKELILYMVHYVNVLSKLLRWWTNICSIPVQQYKRNHDNCFNIKEYRKRKLFSL